VPKGKLRGVLTLGALVFAAMPLARAQEKPARVELIQEIRHAVSPPMRQVIPTPPSPATGLIPLRHPVPGRARTFQPDPALQTSTTTATNTSTSSGSNFNGIASDGYIPPDTNIAVGATQVVETVNVEYAVYDKKGNQVLAPRAIHNIFSALGAPCGTSDGGDPVVLYDHLAGRWLISQLEYNRSFSSNYECVAISQTSDATGSYYLYSLSFGSNLPDYPKWGIWPDGYYLSANLFYRGSTFQGAAACALPRDVMLSGNPVTSSQAICFQDPAEDSLLPADLDGATQPDQGEPEYFANFDSTLELYRFHVDFATPSNSTFTGPIGVSGAASFSQACGGGACVPQPGTNQQLDSLGDRLMYRLSYRNFGTYKSLLVTHSVQANSSGQTGIRWYEIHPASTPMVYQQGTYSPETSTYRWMGSIAQDQNGDIAVGYSVSDGSSTYPGIRYAGRVPTDTPLGTLEAEATIINGSGHQSSYNRWGDYSSMSIDPSDDCTFWYATEYMPSSGSFNWATHIASFKFSGCGTTSSAPAAPTNLSATAGDGQVSLSWTASSGAASYNIYRSTTSGSYSNPPIGSSTGTSYTDTGVTNGTTYYYVVTAVDSNGESGYSNEASATPQAPTAPAPPTNLTAKAAGKSGKISLSWTQSTSPSIVSNNVYRAIGTGGTYGLLATVSATTSYTDSGTTKGTTYCYQVTAVNSSGLQSGASNSSCAVAGATAK
jgi:hypothetical protein